MLTSDLMTAVEGLPDGLYDDHRLGIRLAVESRQIVAWVERDVIAEHVERLNAPWAEAWGFFGDPRQRFLELGVVA